MLTHATFLEYLTQAPNSQDIKLSYIGAQGEQIKQWIINIASMSEIDQCVQIEKTLSELILAKLNDDLRLELMTEVVLAVERLTVQLHNHYIYEAGQLNKTHLEYLRRVKSLYYMCILVYSRVIQRKENEPVSEAIKSTKWKKLLPINKGKTDTLAIAIYWCMFCYQKLLFEFAIAYIKPPKFVWQQLNKMYLMAVTKNKAQLDLSRYTASRNAKTIHQRYKQLCLHSLLNLSTYRRQDIVGINRVLFKWAQYITASLLPETKTEVFVNLIDAQPPEYLTPYTSVNPYDDKYTCLFIELSGLLTYLSERRQVVNHDSKDDLAELRLIDKTFMTLQHQYSNRQRRVSPRFQIKQDATLITGFNSIHYYVAGKSSLGNLIKQSKLPDIYLPIHDTKPKPGKPTVMLEVELLDQSISGYRFRTKNTVNVIAEQHESKKDDKMLTMSLNSSSNWMSESLNFTDEEERIHYYRPPVLQVMSLFAMRTEDEMKMSKWAIGVVRWIETVEDRLQAGGKILGYSATACGIRLENNDGRSQDFVAALLIAGDKNLKTRSSVMLPKYHFKEGDRVILRIKDKQTKLLLSKNVLNSDDVTQYEVVKIAG